MHTKIKLSLLGIVITTIATSSYASNADVINFLSKVNAAAVTDRPDQYREAVNAYVNLNARDRMVSAGIAHTYPEIPAIAQVITTGQKEHPNANIPQGWDPIKTAQFVAHMGKPQTDVQSDAVDAADTTSIDLRSVMVAPALAPTTKSALQDAIAHANAQPLTRGEAAQVINPIKADVATHTADIEKLNNRADRIHKIAADAEVHAEDAQDTANNASNLAEANTLAIQSKVDQAGYDADNAAQANRDNSQDTAIHHATVNSNAALKANAAQSQIIKTNADNIDTLKGLALEQANRDRTSSQHATIEPVDGKDGLNGKDGITTTVTKVETDTATQESVKGLQLTQANQQRTAQQHVTEQTLPVATVDKTAQAKADQNSTDIAANKRTIATNAKAAATAETEAQTAYGVAADAKASALHAQDKADVAYSNTEVNAIGVQNNQQAIASNRAANRATQSQTDLNTQQISKLNSNFSSLKSQVNENKKQASAGTSAAMAQANIPQVLNGQTFAVGAGVGGYDGESAVAAGFSARITQNVTMKATVSDDTAQNFGYGAGVSVGW